MVRSMVVMMRLNYKNRFALRDFTERQERLSRK